MVDNDFKHEFIKFQTYLKNNIENKEEFNKKV